jgi:hypothetical protein
MPAARADAATVHLDEPARERADAETAGDGRRADAPARTNRKQLRQHVRRNADAVVAHADLDVARAATPRPGSCLGSVNFVALLIRLPRSA